MASQKLTNCCVAAIAFAASTYVSTPHCSTIARFAFGAFCLAIDIDAFLQKHQNSLFVDISRPSAGGNARK
jgi:ABC-type transport system involved in multi-copper enzyme maturation permease subunit